MHDVAPQIRPQLLAQFVTLVAHGDVGSAAEALNTSAAAVTKMVRTLERDTGQPLVRPDERELSLTPAGTVLVESARRVLAALERFEDVARTDRATVRMAHVANADTASTLIGQVAARHPEMRFDERVVPCRRQLDDVRSHRLDIAVCTLSEPLPEGLEGLLLRLDPLLVVSEASGRVTASYPGGAGPLLAPLYGAAWPGHDATVDGYSRATGCAIERVAVPGGTGRETLTLLREAAGRRVLVAASALGGAAVDVDPFAPRDPYQGWYLVWRRDDASAEVRRIVDSASDIAERLGWLDLRPGGGVPWLLHHP